MMKLLVDQHHAGPDMKCFLVQTAVSTEREPSAVRQKHHHAQRRLSYLIAVNGCWWRRNVLVTSEDKILLHFAITLLPLLHQLDYLHLCKLLD